MKSLICEICRWAAVAAAIVFLASMGNASAQSRADPRKVLDSVCAAAEMSGMQEAPNQMVKRLYGLNPADYEFCALYYPLTNMDVDELLVIKYSDGSQEAAIRAAAQNRLDSQKNVFESYGVGQMELLSNHSFYAARSGFAVFAVNARADEIHAAFVKALEED